MPFIPEPAFIYTVTWCSNIILSLYTTFGYDFKFNKKFKLI